jgi:flagellar basal body rod protein FlgG
MRIACVTLVAPLCLLGLACQSSRYVTHQELQDLLRIPPGEVSAAGQAPPDINALVAKSFAAPDAETRAAAALATADQRTARLTSALAAIDRALAVCSDNLANGGTTAYKRQTVAHDPTGSVAFHPDFEQGSLENTGRPLDVALQGDGMLRVAIPGGVGYTRNGNFFINHEGVLVLGMGDGYRLEPSISVPKSTTEIAITQSGAVEARVSGSARHIAVGQIPVVRFLSPERLHLRGGSLFTETDASGPAEEIHPSDSGAPQILQGFLEASNVDPTRERIRMTFLKNWREAILRAIDAVK